MESDRERVESEITADPLVAEVKWGLFCSAAGSYKKDFLLKPFPPFFQNGDIKDFSKLNEVINSIPGDFRNLRIDNLNEEQTRILLWVLSDENFRLQRLSDQVLVKDIIRLCTDEEGGAPMPSYAFKVNHLPQSEAKFEEVKSQHGSLFAFHGSQLSCFYSILHFGLIANLNKTAAFGEGTYVSDELGVSLHWSPMASPGRAHLSIGERLGCIAVCEVIKDPSGVKFPSKKAPAVTSSQLPEKYVIVANDSLIRVRYVLVYAEERKKRVVDWRREWRAWARSHWVPLLITFYSLLLLAAFLSDSRNLRGYIRRLSDFWAPEHPFPFDDS